MKNALFTSVLGIFLTPGFSSDFLPENLPEDVSVQPAATNGGARFLVTISGTIFHDTNGNTDGIMSGLGTNIGGKLFINLYNELGAPVATTAVASDGTYSITGDFSGYHNVQLNTNQDFGQGIPAAAYPAPWTHCGERLGIGQNPTPTDGLILLNITTDGSITNADFSVQQYPTSQNKSYIIAQPVPNSFLVLNGTGSGSSPGPLSAQDPEDGSLGAGKSFRLLLTDLNNNEVYYNSSKVVSGSTIPNYNPDLLSVKFTNSSSNFIGFFYQLLDNAGFYGNSGYYQMTWSSLPVTLIKFSATLNDAGADLNWSTSQEENSDHFEIQRSIDGKSWQTLGTVGAGQFSTDLRDYTFRDKTITKTTMYRLKMIDLDQTFAYSSIKTVAWQNREDRSFLYPNPAQNTLYVANASRVTGAKVFTTAGKLVLEAKPSQTGEIDTSELPAGNYFVSIDMLDGSCKTSQLVLER